MSLPNVLWESVDLGTIWNLVILLHLSDSCLSKACCATDETQSFCFSALSLCLWRSSSCCVLGAKVLLEHSHVLPVISWFTSYIWRCCLNMCLTLAMKTSGVALFIFCLDKWLFLSLFPLSLRNIQLLSLVPLMPACVGKELAGMITVFLYLSSIILIPDFLTSCSQLTWWSLMLAQGEAF